MWTYQSLQAEKDRVEALGLHALLVEVAPYLNLLTGYQQALREIERLRMDRERLRNKLWDLGVRDYE